MEHRSQGYVNFPDDNKGYHWASENGLSVTLVVLDTRDPSTDATWEATRSTYASSSYIWCAIDCFQGDHTASAYGEIFTRSVMVDRYFPNRQRHMDDNSNSYDPRQYDSFPLLAAITIGTTDCAIWADDDSGYFRATFDDLTDEGTQMVALLMKLYPNKPIALLTGLDT